LYNAGFDDIGTDDAGSTETSLLDADEATTVSKQTKYDDEDALED